MIDASASTSSFLSIVDSRLADGYTVVSYATGAGNGATIKPNVGDTGKRLFLPNSGRRWMSGSDGDAQYYGERVYFWTAEERQSNTSQAWYLYFYDDYSGGASRYGLIGNSTKLNAYSIRCVRS